MNKLNVTDGEWCTDLRCDGYSYIYTNDTDDLVATVYDNTNDAILMSQSKKLYEQLLQIDNLIMTRNSPLELADDLVSMSHDINQLLKTCRGEQHTCKN